jgi:hypothetical protein
MRVLSIMMIPAKPANEMPSQEQIDQMNALIADWKGKGILVDTGGTFGEMLELTIARKNGNTTVTDGPFTEAKEVVGGYALLEARDRDDVIALTEHFLDVLGSDATCLLHEVSVA